MEWHNQLKAENIHILTFTIYQLLYTSDIITALTFRLNILKISQVNPTSNVATHELFKDRGIHPQYDHGIINDTHSTTGFHIVPQIVFMVRFLGKVSNTMGWHIAYKIIAVVIL